MGKKVLFFLGLLDQFHRYKGLDYLLEALAIVKKQMPDVKLLVGAAGELLSYYRDMAARLSLSDSVEFLGFRSGR
jgi:glycosyltransferase involved in cell wall biosynthesis